MTKREEIITELLERYEDLVDPTTGPFGIAGTGERLPLMPLTYTTSVRELERLMTKLRDERRTQWWHVHARYIAATHVARNVPVKRKGKNGKTATVLERRIVTVYDQGVRLEKVRRGIAWLATNWSLPTEPMLPSAVLERAARQKAA